MSEALDHLPDEGFNPMDKKKDISSISQEIIQAGKELDQKGWVPATSGNFSARLNENNLAITASGKHKGKLKPEDILITNLAGEIQGGENRPSAETALHLAIYKNLPAVGAILHTHSKNATLLSTLGSEQDDLILENYEILKALQGIRSHEERICIPRFNNTQDMKLLAHKVEKLLEKKPRTYGFLIRGHGLYTWGQDMKEALRHMEALEFIFSCELELKRGLK